MIIWINGAFGSGKTTVAHILKDQFSKAFIYDPEIIGDTLNRLLPKPLQREDFQDYPEWRQWNCDSLRELSENYDGTIIVPMTIYKAESYLEVIDVLKQEDIPLFHLILNVSKEKIIERLKQRQDGTLEWGLSKADDILKAFDQMPVDEKLSYDNMTPHDAVNAIVERWDLYCKRRGYEVKSIEKKR